MISADDLVSLIRQTGVRWLAVGQALRKAIDQDLWKVDAAPSPTAWLDQLAARGGRSSTYLARCLSGARYVGELKDQGIRLNEVLLATRPLSVLEELRRRAGNDANAAAKLLPQIESGQLKYQDFRRMLEKDHEPRRRAEQAWFAQAIEQRLPELLHQLGCSPQTTIYTGAPTSLGRFDAVCVDPASGATTLVEIKSALSARALTNIVQQLVAYAHLAHRVWLVLSSDTELPAETIINRLGDVAIKNVGVVLIDPADISIARVMPIEEDAAPSTTRDIFKKSLMGNERDPAP